MRRGRSALTGDIVVKRDMAIGMRGLPETDGDGYPAMVNSFELDWPLHESAGFDIVCEKPAGGAISALVQTTWFQLLLCLAAAVPLLWPQMPPLTDLGGHLGGIAVQIDGGATASLRQWYSFHWGVIPNLGVDLLMQALAPAIGLEPAMKAIVIGIVVAQAAGLLGLARVVHGKVPPTTLLALPLIYSYPFQYGFLNFTLSTALGTCALALWIGMDRPELRMRRWLVFLGVGGVLWLCHLAGWALFCLFAAGYELARWRAQGLTWANACLRSAVPLSCLLAPVLLFAFCPHPHGSSGPTTGWFDLLAKLGMIVMALRDRWAIWDVASALLLVGVIGWSWRSPRFSRHSGLALGCVFAGVAFILLPKHIAGTSFVDMRLVPMILAVELVAVCPRDDVPRAVLDTLLVAALIFVGARLLGNTASFVLLDRQFTQDLAVLQAVPRDAQLVTLTLKPCVTNEPWQRERRTHLAGYALARRHDYANDQWVVPGGQLLQVHNPGAGSFIGDPSQTGSPTACRGRPGIFAVVHSIPAAVGYLWILENGVARRFAGWHAIQTSSGSVLYRRD